MSTKQPTYPLPLQARIQEFTLVGAPWIGEEPPRSPAGPGHRPMGGPGGRSTRKLMRIRNLGIWGGNGNAKNGCILGGFFLGGGDARRERPRLNPRLHCMSISCHLSPLSVFCSILGFVTFFLMCHIPTNLMKMSCFGPLRLFKQRSDSGSKQLILISRFRFCILFNYTFNEFLPVCLFPSV